jgi:hypothetical protein
LLASFDLCWMCQNVDVDVGCAVLGVLALAQIMGSMGYQTCVTEISSCIINHSHSFRHQLHRILSNRDRILRLQNTIYCTRGIIHRTIEHVPSQISCNRFRSTQFNHTRFLKNTQRSYSTFRGQLYDIFMSSNYIRKQKP